MENVHLDRLGLSLELRPLVVQMSHSFGTSHSVTTERRNALLVLKFQCDPLEDPTIGYGECGLPPKKKNVYYTDYEDVKEVFKQIYEALGHFETNDRSLSEIDTHDAFHGINGDYLILRSKDRIPSALKLLLFVIDSEVGITEKTSAALAMFEIAIFDAWCKYAGLTWRSAFQHGTSSHVRATSSSATSTSNAEMTTSIHGTISLGSSMDEMEGNADRITEIVPKVKIKLSDDEEGAKRVLRVVNGLLMRKHGEDRTSICVDANCAWSIQTAQAMLPVLKEAGVSICEQPMPAEVGRTCSEDAGIDLDSWRKIKEDYAEAGIEMLADESSMLALSEERLLSMSKYFTSISIKLEKTAGVRGSLMVIETCGKLGLKLWASQMVSGSVNTTAIAGLLHLCNNRGDTDGSLIISGTIPMFKGGIEILDKGNVKFPERNGLGIAIDED